MPRITSYCYQKYSILNQVEKDIVYKYFARINLTFFFISQDVTNSKVTQNDQIFFQLSIGKVYKMNIYDV
jgi:hypothetical protein